MDSLDRYSADGDPDCYGSPGSEYCDSNTEMTDDENKVLRELREDVRGISSILRGDDKGAWGLTHQVRLMWRIFIIWPLCTASAFTGAAVTLLLQNIFHR